VALIIAVIEAVAAAISGEQLLQMLAFGQLFVFAVVWAIANSVVVRRG